MQTDLIIQDCLFPTDNDLEIPTLRLDRQPSVVDIPFLCFGEQKRTYDMMGCGTLHFYTDDYRFSAIYDKPQKVLKMRPRNIVEPNFSLFNDTPIAFGMQPIYKKRMLARLMQENGIGVFVDLNVAPKFYKLNLLGVPKGYGAFCTRGYSDRLPHLEYEYRIARAVAGSNELLFVVYGGGADVRKFCQSVGAIYVTPTVAIKQKIKAMSAIDNTIAFHGINLTRKELEEYSAGQYAAQIENFNPALLVEDTQPKQLENQ